MKKYVGILVICLVLCGCGCSKNKTNKKVEESAIGNYDVSYSLEITCNGKVKESSVALNKDKTASYTLYECNNDVLQLITGKGTYKVSESSATITGEYGEKV